MSNKVQILDENTANQIAAGEVIERPAAAVKELVENALDAGARRVVVELEDGGRSLVRVTDDGSGMGQEDAILALQRHATSKIHNADDLFRITTMGFRGEALPSIASVAQVTITTKEAGDVEGAGVELRCLGGTLENVTEIGARAGTSITVENLFYNVPARLKFLKSAQTELGHVVELIQRLALARPDVAFRLMHHGQEVFASTGSGDLLDACVKVFGRDAARNLIPLSYTGAGLAVTGYLGTPAALKSSRAAQHTFVNRRFVRSKAVTRALDEGYKSVQNIHGARYPVAVILIEVDPAHVDVNVSPTKTEVRFTRESDIFTGVHRAVKEGLMAGGLVATILDKAEVAPPAPNSEDRPPAPNSGGAGNGYAPLLNVPPRPAAHVRHDSEAFHVDVQQNAGLQPMDDDPFEDAGFAPPIPPLAEGEARWGYSPAPPELGARGRSDYRRLSSVQVLAQTRNRYILAQTEHALVLIDQHIAHERVLYERLKAGAEGGGSGVPVQRLMLPLTLELDKRAAMVVTQRLEELRLVGFELEPFGGDSFVVRAVPASLAQKRIKAQEGPEATLREIIEELVEKTTSRRLLVPADEVLTSASCKMAVKAGDPLSFEEMDALVADLLLMDNPYTCPHGRPIIIELPNMDIDRKFGR